MKKPIFTLYRNIKYLRKQNRLTTGQLAEIIEISEKKLIAAERCEDVGYLYDKHLKNICLYFKVGADMLFNERLYNG